MSSSSASPQLRTVLEPEEIKSIVVVIPSPGCRNIASWGRWIYNVAGPSNPKPAIYFFDHNLPNDEFPGWQYLLHLGDELVVALVELHQKLKDCSPSIVIVAHGLGGIIAKQAYRSISQQINYVRYLSDSVAAIIFLGTPHSRVAADSVWSRMISFLRQRKSTRRRDEVNHSEPAALCSEFEDAANALPILSINETQETPISSKGIRFISTKTLLIGSASGATNARREKLLDAHVDHSGLCNLDFNAALSEGIHKFLASALLQCSEWIEAQNFPREPHTEFAASSICSGSRTPLSTQGQTSVLSLIPPTQPSMFLPLAAHPAAAPMSREPMSDTSDPVLPCHIVPYERNGEFFGRQCVLKGIEDHLLPSAHSEAGRAWANILRTYAICGSGGMGKTQTATEFALAHANDFDAILWMKADTHANLAADFSAAAIELGLIRDDSLDAKDLAVTRELVKGWLNNPVRSYRTSNTLPANNATWLLIFDNADTRDILVDFWPVDGSTGSVLITSRDPLAKTKFYGVDHGIDLQPFSLEESTTLLLRLTQREDDHDEHSTATAVSKQLAGFPLALTQMAGVISRQELSFDEFLARYKEEHAHKDLFELHFETRPGSVAYQHTLATVFSLDTIEKHGMSLLEVISLMNSDVSEIIFESVLGHERLRDFPQTATEYQDARTELTKSSLITRNRKTRTLSVNIIVQDAACARMNSYRFIPVFKFALRLITRAWPRAGPDAIRQDNRRWKECEKLRPHALRLKDRFSKQAAAVQSTLALSVQFASLLNEVGWYLQERVQTQLAIECFTTARDNLMRIIAEEQVNPSSRRSPTVEKQEPTFDKVGDIDTSQALEDDGADPLLLLAETYRYLGFSATDICEVDTAYENYLEYNRLMVDQFGQQERPSDARLAISYLELAVAHGFRLDYENSKFCSEKALELCRWIPSTDKMSVAASGMVIQTLAVANLSLALLELGEPLRARDMALRALTDREKKVGVDDRTSFLTGRLLHALGNILFVLGQEAESFQFHWRAMLHYKETVGPNYHRTGDMCFKVAQHHLLNKSNDEARDYMNQSLSIYRDQAYYGAERARVLHWKSKITLGEEAVRFEADAQQLLRDTWKKRHVEGSTFEDHDYDRMVVFWSR